MAAARPFVWVREDSGRGFAKVATAGLDDVYDLAAAAGGVLDLGAGAHCLELFLVAPPGPQPSPAAVDAVLSSAAPLDAPAALAAAGVVPGSWLVVRVDARAAACALERQARLDAEAAARSAAAVAAEQARLVRLAASSSGSSISPRSFKSLASAHSKSREAGASAAFWTLTHAAFPGAALERVLGRLLDERRLISNRAFKAGDFPAAFEAGRAAFAAATLDAEKPPAPTHGIQGINFSGDYTKAAYASARALRLDKGSRGHGPPLLHRPAVPSAPPCAA